MKVLLIFALVVSLSYGRDGKHNPDISGRYVHNPNDGKYIPDNSGQYIPDYSGLYYYDGSGIYKSDGTGYYKADKDGNFRDKNGNIIRFGSGAGFINVSKGKGSFGGKLSTFSDLFSKSRDEKDKNANLIGAGSNENRQTIRPSAELINKGLGFGGSGSQNIYPRATTGKSSDGHWRILRQSGDVQEDGYHWEYETENKIIAQESGKLANKGTDKEAMRADGFFQYVGPDNIQYSITYTADENGFVPQGDHLPTPPPIPEAILRSLDFLKKSGKL